MNLEPQRVDVSLSQGVTIQWKDGRSDHLAVLTLRRACPCATCNDLHGTGETPTAMPQSPFPMFKPQGATLQGVEPVGRYALQFTFSDGHKTGIFTWEYLRELGERPSEP